MTDHLPLISRRSLLAVVPVGLLAAGCGSAVTGEGGGGASGDGAGGTITVAHVASTLFSPLYVAQAKGYFKDQGLTVELQTIKSGQDAIPLLASGKLQAMCAGFSAGMFNALQSGLQFSVVGSMGMQTGDEKESPTSLVVSKAKHDAGVDSLAKLKGTKVAMAGGPGATGGYLTAAIIKEAGLGLTDISAVNIATPDMAQALKSGGADAALMSAPASTSVIESGEAVSLGIPAKGVSSTGVMYGPAFAGGADAQKFFNALVKASGDLQGDGAKSEEIITILAEATGQKPEVLKAAPGYLFDPKLAPKAESLTDMQTLWMEGGQITYKEPRDVAGIVDQKFSQNAG